jgi:hypothetical protein
MNLLVYVLLHWSLLAMYAVFINRVQVTWKNPWCDVTRVDIQFFTQWTPDEDGGTDRYIVILP